MLLTAIISSTIMQTEPVVSLWLVKVLLPYFFLIPLCHYLGMSTLVPIDNIDLEGITKCSSGLDRIIIYAMEQTKSFDTKVVADFLMNMESPIPGITGPLQFAKDGNRVGSSYMTFEIQADGSYKVVHAQ